MIEIACENCGHVFYTSKAAKLKICLICSVKDKKETKPELETESQLRERLQRCCDLMNECGFDGCKVFDDGNNGLFVYGSDECDVCIFGKTIQFKLGLKAPEKFRTVMWRGEISNIIDAKFGMSSGTFNSDG